MRGRSWPRHGSTCAPTPGGPAVTWCRSWTRCWAREVDIIHLREKSLEAGEELRLLAVFADLRAGGHGRLLAVNDRADVALAAGADVLHLGQDDLRCRSRGLSSAPGR